MPENTSRKFGGWRVAALCGLTQNLAVGIAFGSFGPLLASTEVYFATSRTMVTLGMSVTNTTIGLLSLLLGGLFERISIRSAMMGAALISAMGYWGLALLPSFATALPMYALIGTGVTLLGILGPVALINRWFDMGRGRMLGLLNLPIVLLLLPFAIAHYLPIYGRTNVLLGLGASFIILIPLLFFVIDRPAKIGQTPWTSGGAGSVAKAGARGRQTIAEAVRKPQFWLLSIGIGIVNGSASAFVVHSVPFGREEAMSIEAAAALLSIYAGAGLIGTPLLGWMADRLSGPTTLALTAACQSVLWVFLLWSQGNALYFVAALLGLCAVPINVLHQATMSELLEPSSVGRGIGISYIVKLPFVFSFAPLMSILFEQSNGYRLPFLIASCALCVAVLLFLAGLFARRRENAALCSVLVTRRA